MANITVLIMGRATGKTDGPISDTIQNHTAKMPRSVGGLAGITYESLLTKIIPGIVRGLERYGYIRDTHYFIGHAPPKAWKWPIAYRQVLKHDKYISFLNGSGLQLLSLDRSISNGTDLDYIIYDEARYFKEEKVREVNLAVRGNSVHFGHLSCHHSQLYTTDRPRDASGQWLYDIAKQMDPERIELIKAIQFKVHSLKKEQRLVSSAADRKQLQYAITRYEKDLNIARKDAVHYLEASTFDNAKILGLDVLKNYRRTLSDNDWDISVLNKRIIGVENGFYPLFNESEHTYTASDAEHIAGLDFSMDLDKKRNVLWDRDVNLLAPLDVACDWGSSINCMAIGQLTGEEYRVLNALSVEHPLRIKDLVDKFVAYYRHHSNKRINHYYDHTAIGGNAMNEDTYASEFKRLLQKHGWHVNDIYVGQAARHDYKYKFIGRLLNSDPFEFAKIYEVNRVPKIRINRLRCEWLIISIQGAALKQTRKGFEKEKKAERDHTIDQKTTTHFSDAFDTLILNVLKGFSAEPKGFTGGLVIG